MSKVSRKRYTFNKTSLYLEMFRPGPVTYCRPEPPCVVTDIPKRDMETPSDGGTKVCSNVPGHMTKMVVMPIYGKNPLKIFFSRTRRSMTLGLGM